MREGNNSKLFTTHLYLGFVGFNNSGSVIWGVKFVVFE